MEYCEGMNGSLNLLGLNLLDKNALAIRQNAVKYLWHRLSLTLNSATTINKRAERTQTQLNLSSAHISKLFKRQSRIYICLFTMSTAFKGMVVFIQNSEVNT